MTTLYEPIGAIRSSYDKLGRASYTRTIAVITDSVVTNPNDIASLPELGAGAFSICPYDITAALDRIEPKQDTEEMTRWLVDLTWSRVSVDHEQAKPPLERRIKVRWGGRAWERGFSADRNGNAPQNSAGDPYTDLRTDDRHTLIIATSNQSEVPSWIEEIRGYINDATITVEGRTILKNCARIVDTTVGFWQREFEQDFREVSIEIEARRPKLLAKATIGNDIGTGATVISNYLAAGWQRVELDQGFRQIASGKLVKILDDKQFKLSKPALLDGKGAAQATPVSAGSEVYRVFDEFPEADFSILNLPP